MPPTHSRSAQASLAARAALPILVAALATPLFTRPAAAQDSLLGATVRLTTVNADNFDCPNAQTDQGERVVGEGPEWPGLDITDDPNLLAETAVDIGANTIDLDYSALTPADFFIACGGGENTLVFTDTQDTVPPIVGAALDPELSLLSGLDDSDITFTENEIRINTEGTFATFFSFARIVVTFEGDQPCPCDVNADTLCDSADFFAWVNAFGSQAPACDVNADALCDSADFFAWVNAFGQGC